MDKENREVGKGEKWRKGTNYQNYRNNFDKIVFKPLRSEVKAPPTKVHTDLKKESSLVRCRKSKSQKFNNNI